MRRRGEGEKEKSEPLLAYSKLMGVGGVVACSKAEGDWKADLLQKTHGEIKG